MKQNSASMALAKHLLLEIQSESLQKLLTTVRQKTKPTGPTAIPALDLYLLTGSPSVNTEWSSGNAIVIQGSPGSGKTHLLYFLLATCVLPVHHLSCCVGGWNKVAFILDLDGHFHMSRFRDVLVNRLQQSVPAPDISAIADRCLELVHVFHPTSISQLTMTLQHLAKYHSQKFPTFELGMIAVHSIDASHWLERFKAEQTRSSLVIGKSPLESASSVLRELKVSYGLTTVVTHWGLLHPYMDPHDYGQQAPRSTYVDPVLKPLTDLIITASRRDIDHSLSKEFRWVAQAGGKSHSVEFSFVINESGIATL